MHIRRLLGTGLALALLFSAAPAVAQRSNTNPNPPQTLRTQPDPDTVALVQLVDAAIVAAPIVQVGDTTVGDIVLKWESAHFIKGQNGVYVPFTISFDPSSIRTSDVGIYVRAVEKGQLSAVAASLTPPAAPAAGAKPPTPPAVPKYSWDNVHFVPKPADGRITRALALPPGDYELFVALKERSVSPTAAVTNPPGTQSSRNGLLRHAVLAPDFNKPELQTSSVILASSVEPVAPAPPPVTVNSTDYHHEPCWSDHDYSFDDYSKWRSADAGGAGGESVHVRSNADRTSREGRFGKNNELQVIFWVYGATASAAGKPDVTIDFNFYLKQPDGAEKYFNKTMPQELNAKTLPPEFNAAAGHQLPGSLIVPVAPFPAGDYRLEIKVTDKPSGKVVTQNVTFTVTG